jgi:hypothetical protein
VGPQATAAEVSSQPTDPGLRARQRQYDDRQQHQATPEADHGGGETGAGPGTQLVGQAAVDL